MSRPLRNCHTAFHNGWINLHSHQQCKKCSYFSTSFPASVVSRFFNDWHTNWCEMVSQCGFDSHLEWWVIMSIFSYVYWPYICLLLKSVCSYPLPTFEWVCLFFSCKSVLILCRFWILSLCQMGRLQTFFPILLVANSL